MSLVVYIITLVTAAVGVVISDLIISNIAIQSLGGLNQVQIQLLLSAFLWFLISLTTFMGAKRVEAESFGFISLKFIIAWASCTAGALIGFVIALLIDSGSVQLNWDNIATQFFIILPLTIGPTATTAMGLKEK